MMMMVMMLMMMSVVEGLLSCCWYQVSVSASTYGLYQHYVTTLHKIILMSHTWTSPLNQSPNFISFSTRFLITRTVLSSFERGKITDPETLEPETRDLETHTPLVTELMQLPVQAY